MKILIVDDNADNRSLLKAGLDHYGWSAVEARDGEDGLMKARGERPDLIISDILMPKMDGFQLCHAVKADSALKDIPFIFYTATYTTEKDRDFAMSLGASGFIKKPTDPDEFMGIIKEVLTEHGKGLAQPGEPSMEKETEYLKDHEARLIQKLDDKLAQLQETNLALEREVEQRKQLEKELKDSATRYRIVANNTSGWEFWLDPEGRFNYTSPSSERMTGRTAEEFMADPSLILNIIHPEDRLRFEMHRNEATKEKMPDALQFRIVRSDGDIRWIDHICQSVFDEEGRFLGTRGSNRDITEQKKVEEALRESKTIMEAVIEAAPT